MTALKELTAKPDRCGLGTCPAVFQDESTGKLVIIGAKAVRQEIAGRVGKGEDVIEIDRGLVFCPIYRIPIVVQIGFYVRHAKDGSMPLCRAR